jgi:hypothetical protein
MKLSYLTWNECVSCSELGLSVIIQGYTYCLDTFLKFGAPEWL